MLNRSRNVDIITKPTILLRCISLFLIKTKPVNLLLLRLYPNIYQIQQGYTLRINVIVCVLTTFMISPKSIIKR